MGRLGAVTDVDNDEMRRHLTGAASTQQDRGGPGRESTEMMALSMVSTDLGRLTQRVEELSQTLQELRQGQDKHQALADQVTKLAEQVTDIGNAVTALGEKEPPAPPPQPWDWDAMSTEEETEAILLLAKWVETVLAPWWPRTVGPEGLPPCWMRHPDMRRNMSLVMVAYQQAYEHDHRRVHHEVDFRRTLDDMMRDVREAAKAYRCRPKQGEKKPHVVRHHVRPERKRAHEYLRTRALGWIAQADREGDQERVTSLMEEYSIDPDDLRAHMSEVFDQFLRRVVDDTVPGDAGPVVRETGRILATYQVVPVDALEYAPDLEALLKKLYGVDPARFAELRPVYEPLLRKYTVITEYVGEMSGQPTPQAAALMEKYGITDSDVVRVRNMLAKPRR